jgi:hypothetical protein
MAKKWIVVCGWLWAFIALIPISNAGWSVGWRILLLPSFYALMCGWFHYSFSSSTERWSHGFRVLWLSVVLSWITVFILDSTSYALIIRIQMCENELKEFAETVRRGEDQVQFTSSGKQVGLFEVYGTWNLGKEGTLMTVRGFYESYGISYCPEGPPPSSGSEYQHLFGPWYRHVDDF